MADQQDNKVYGFSREDAADLIQILGRGRSVMPRNRPSIEGGFIALTPSGGIAKRVGNTVSTALCDLYYLDGTGDTWTLTSMGISERVGNMSSAANIGGSQYIMCELRGGKLVCDWEDCQE